MEKEQFTSARQFLGRAGSLLEGDIPRNQLMVGIAETVASQPDVYPIFHAWVITDRGDPVIAASCTPPHNFIISDSDDESFIEAIVDELMDSGVSAPGVMGNRPTVDEFARIWGSRSGGMPRVRLGQGVFSLEAVDVVPMSPGEMRPARQGDRDLLIEWWMAFLEEADVGEQPSRQIATERLDQRLDPNRSQSLRVWAVDDQVVSMSGENELAGGARIGPVYTPPPLRGHGYATSLVAEQSRALLDGGLKQCLLYTDLANPTSNAIYKRIGYRQVAESRIYQF